MHGFFSDEVFVLYSCSFETEIETCSIYNHGEMKWRKHSVCLMHLLFLGGLLSTKTFYTLLWSMTLKKLNKNLECHSFEVILSAAFSNQI